MAVKMETKKDNAAADWLATMGWSDGRTGTGSTSSDVSFELLQI